MICHSNNESRGGEGDHWDGGRGGIDRVRREVRGVEGGGRREKERNGNEERNIKGRREEEGRVKERGGRERKVRKN